MPLEVIIDDENRKLYPTTKYKKIPLNNLYINVDNDYYVLEKNISSVSMQPQ